MSSSTSTSNSTKKLGTDMKDVHTHLPNGVGHPITKPMNGDNNNNNDDSDVEDITKAYENDAKLLPSASPQKPTKRPKKKATTKKSKKDSEAEETDNEEDEDEDDDDEEEDNKPIVSKKPTKKNNKKEEEEESEEKSKKPAKGKTPKKSATKTPTTAATTVSTSTLVATTETNGSAKKPKLDKAKVLKAERERFSEKKPFATLMQNYLGFIRSITGIGADSKLDNISLDDEGHPYVNAEFALYNAASPYFKNKKSVDAVVKAIEQSDTAIGMLFANCGGTYYMSTIAYDTCASRLFNLDKKKDTGLLANYEFVTGKPFAEAEKETSEKRKAKQAASKAKAEEESKKRKEASSSSSSSTSVNPRKLAALEFGLLWCDSCDNIEAKCTCGESPSKKRKTGHDNNNNNNGKEESSKPNPDSSAVSPSSSSTSSSSSSSSSNTNSP